MSTHCSQLTSRLPFRVQFSCLLYLLLMINVKGCQMISLYCWRSRRSHVLTHTHICFPPLLQIKSSFYTAHVALIVCFLHHHILPLTPIATRAVDHFIFTSLLCEGFCVRWPCAQKIDNKVFNVQLSVSWMVICHFDTLLPFSPSSALDSNQYVGLCVLAFSTSCHIGLNRPFSNFMEKFLWEWAPLKHISTDVD